VQVLPGWVDPDYIGIIRADTGDDRELSQRSGVASHARQFVRAEGLERAGFSAVARAKVRSDRLRSRRLRSGSIRWC